MLITCRLFGQMCNQIQTLAHQIASHREYRIRYGLLYTRFEHAQHFKNLTRVRGLTAFNSRYISKLIIWTLKALSTLTRNHQPFKIYTHVLDDAGDETKSLLARKGFNHLNLLEKFPYYDHDSLCKHYDYIKTCFEFAPALSSKIHNELAKHRTTHDTIIGVHVRRGDYKEWLGGKYHFDDTTYTKACANAATALGLKTERTLFIICSHEHINIENYSLPRRMNSFGQNAMEDLCILANCDYIISTQSTFTGWASFYGKVPTFRIRPESLAPQSRSDFLIHFFETDGAGLARSKERGSLDPR